MIKRLNHFLISVFMGLSFGSLSVLAISSVSKRHIPCGLSATCDSVSRLSLSKVFGLPLHWYGMAVIIVAYLAWSVFKKPLVGSILLGVMAAVSLCMQFIVNSRYNLWCGWCALAAFSALVGAISCAWSVKEDEIGVEYLGTSLLSAGFVLLVANRIDATSHLNWMSALSKDRFTSLRHLNIAKKYVVFGNIDCPACKELDEELVLGRSSEKVQLEYFDVNGISESKQNKAFREAWNAGDYGLAKKLLEGEESQNVEVKGPLVLPKAIVSLHLQYTPSIFMLVGEDNSVELSSGELIERLKLERD